MRRLTAPNRISCGGQWDGIIRRPIGQRVSIASDKDILCANDWKAMRAAHTQGGTSRHTSPDCRSVYVERHRDCRPSIALACRGYSETTSTPAGCFCSVTRCKARKSSNIAPGQICRAHWRSIALGELFRKSTVTRSKLRMNSDETICERAYRRRKTGESRSR